ncbi:MAG: 4-hydroxy-tetrahydrodipicolinate synthase, partial [Nitrospirota bacterium]
MFSGSLVAIVTPFSKGKFDEKAMADLIEFHIANGTDGIVPCGTTGESATLTPDEHERVVAVTVEVVNKRITVIAGTGSNSTDEAIIFTKHAKAVGADGALLITPYYNKPTQEGLFRHFEAVAKAVDLPQILYNIPGRTSINMLPDTTARLSQIPSIIGIKEGSGSLQQVSEIIHR